jgi:hypothetical protein
MDMVNAGSAEADVESFVERAAAQFVHDQRDAIALVA